MKKSLTSLILLGLMMAFPAIYVSNAAPAVETKADKTAVSTEDVSTENEDKPKADAKEKSTLSAAGIAKWEVTGLTLNDKASYVTANQSNTIRLDSTYSRSDVKYKFVYSYNNWSDWDVIQGFSTSNSAKWTPKKEGKYKIYVDIYENGKTTTKTFDVLVKKSWEYKGVKADKSMVLGKNYTISPDVTGGGNLQYKFVYSYNNWNDWDVIQNFSTKSTATFIPKNYGSYEIFIDIKDNHGHIETKSVKVSSNYGWSFNGINCVNSTDIDKAIAVSANTSGDNSDLQYKFVYSYNNWSDWGVIRGFSENSSASFKAPRAGKYDIYVDVKDKAGNIVTKSKAVTVNSSWNYSEVKLSSSSVNAGSSVTVSPVVTGSKSILRYKFVYSRDGWSDWGVIQDFATNSSISFNPKKAGSYEFYVDIMDITTGQIVTKKAAVNVKTNWSFTGVQGGGNVAIGNSVTFSPKLTGNTGGLKYKFVYSYENWSDWGVFKEESTTNTAKFTPKKPGKYTIYIDITDTLGNTVTKTAPLSVTPDWSFVGISLSTANADPGDTVTITPKLTGKTGGLKYKFVYSYMNWSEWGVIRDFSTVSNGALAIKKPGYYDVYVDITDRTGYTVTKHTQVTSAGGMIKVINADWFSTVNAALPRGGNYTVVDVETGKRFTVKRWAGRNHADMEPLTVKDTAILKDIYGGKFSWDRRPAIVINGTNAYAASLTSMPHGDDTLPNNGFTGHICIHFLNSRTHGTNNKCSLHQAAVSKAAAVGSIKL